MKRTLFDFSFTRPNSNTNRQQLGLHSSENDEPSSDRSRSSDEESHDGDDEPVKKKKKTRTFQAAWLKTWPWLSKTPSNGMTCSLCLKHKKTNSLTTPSGSKNYRTSTLKRHLISSDHVESVREQSMQADFEKAASKAVLSEKDQSVGAALRTVCYMALEDIPIKKYSSMIDLQIIQGCQSLEKLASAKNATYYSRSAGEELQACVAEAIHENILDNIKATDMYSILVDESTDIAVCKQMVVYVRIMDVSFIPRTFFLQNITIDNPKSDAEVLFNAIVKCLQQKELDITKVKGFGSDGASVMVGRHSGVATRIRKKSPHCINIHCVAHRLNLATSQASKTIPYMKDVEKVLSDLYYYFGGSKSGNRKCELEEIQKILDDPVVKIKECHEIRWIAFYEAVFAVYRSWPSLVTYFKRHDDKTAKSFRNNLTAYKFVAVVHILMDILPSISQLSMILQKQDVDVAAIGPALDGLKNKIKLAKKGKGHYQTEFQEKLKKKKEGETTKEVTYKGHKLDFEGNMRKCAKEVEEVRVSFCDNLNKNIEARFPKEAVNVSTAFRVLGMRSLSFMSEEEREEYGNKEIGLLLDHYGNEAVQDGVTSAPLVDKEKCREEWTIAKNLVMEQMYPRDSTKLLWKLMFDFHKDIVPNLLVLAKLCLIMPLQTAECERGFSIQNAIKTARRNRLTSEHLNTLMIIKCEGGSLKEFNYEPALKIWKQKKHRRAYNGKSS